MLFSVSIVQRCKCSNQAKQAASRGAGGKNDKNNPKEIFQVQKTQEKLDPTDEKRLPRPPFQGKTQIQFDVIDKSRQ